MSKYLVGKKLNMTQVFNESGQRVSATIVKAEPINVVRVKKQDEKDGYDAVQVGYGKYKNINKPLNGHSKEYGPYKKFTEFRVNDDSNLELGQNLDVSQFEVGDYVDVQGSTKGRGFAGVIKRHGFKGAPASHGHEKQRISGSIGGMFPQHVLKGKKMSGHMGNVKRTVKHLKVLAIDKDKNLLALKGAIPGSYGGTIKLALSKNKVNKSQPNATE